MQKMVMPPPCSFLGAFSPATANREARTVDIVWYTGARVLRGFWKPYYLELGMEPENIDLSRLSSGKAPFLNLHNDYRLDAVIGVIEKAWLKDGEGFATVRFSKREEVDVIFQDVLDGVLCNISVGVDIQELVLLEEEEGKPPVYKATKWTPYEVSLVPVGADPNAQTLSFRSVKLVGETPEQKKGGMEMQGKVKEKEEFASMAEGAAPSKGTVSSEEGAERFSREEVTRAERRRIQEISGLCARHGMTEEFEKGHIDDGSDLPKVRDAILEKLAKDGPTIVSTGNGVVADERDKQREVLTAVLLNRADPSRYTVESGMGYTGLSLVELARSYLARQGTKTDDLSRYQVAELALCGRTRMGYMTASDFPLILGNAVGKRLLDDYRLAQQTWTPFCSMTTAPDFKPMTVVRLGEASSFKKIPEHGEYERGALSEKGESYSVEKSGLIIALTLEAFVNDDLGAFNRIPRRIASAARRYESAEIYGILTGNPVMADGEALFSAAHKNTVTTGTALSEASLSEAREVFETQETEQGDPMGIYPKFLVVGPKLHTTAQKLLAAEVLATKSADVNVFKNAFTLIVDPRITGKGWYLIADPADVDTIEYAYLEGENGLWTEMRNGFDVDGLEIKARLVFGAAPIDYRGMFYNPGA